MTDIIYKPLFNPDGQNIDIPKNRLTWEHLCLYYGTRVIKSDVLISSSSSTVYTVPTGKIFLLITTNLSMQNEKTGNETGRMFMFDGANTNRMVVCLVGGGTTTNGCTNNATFAPSCPVRMLPGEAITLTSTETSGTTYFEGSLFGYEIDSAIFYRES